MKVRVGAATDIGRARERNEDAFLIEAPLFAVADGMGGHRAGDVASALALETLRGSSESREWDRMSDWVVEANRVVHERAGSNRDLSGMGTTLTGAMVGEDGVVRLVHVGDSRAYLMRRGRLEQLTEDHTLVERMVKEGRISAEEAQSHPQRSILTRALGVDDDIAVDQLEVAVRPGDRIVLCSDGLTGMIREASVAEILQGTAEPQEAAEKLVDAANRAGGLDNITVIVLDFLDDDGTAVAVATVAEGEPAEVAGESEGGEPEPVTDAAVVAVAEPQPVVDEPAPEPPEGPDQPKLADTGFVPVPAEAALARDEAEARKVGLEAEGKWAVGPKPPLVRRLFVWILILVVVLGVAWFGLNWYLDRQWYVGVSDGSVAIYNGIPTEVLGYELHDVDQVYEELPADDVIALGPWQGLTEGINADSREEAVQIVEQIRADLEEGGG
jgi:protein phosphatase